jgi:hypothetical protein
MLRNKKILYWFLNSQIKKEYETKIKKIVKFCTNKTNIALFTKHTKFLLQI